MSLFAACFDGEEARGYPCETDDDCGSSLTCASTGCCGGACLFGTDPGTDATSTSAGTETSTSTSSTTIDPTSVGESSSSTGEPVPECGNEVVEADEECDLGERNEPGTYVECNLNCRAALFYFSSDEEAGDDFCGAEAECGPSWFREDGNTGPWVSGTYPLAPVLLELVSRELMLPAQPPPGKVPVLRIQHDYDFNVCESTKNDLEYFDGGHVMVENEGGTRVPVSPIAGEPDSAPPTCTGAGSPWCDLAPPPFAFVESSAGVVTARLVPLDAFLGERIRLVFELSFDTGNCDPPNGHGGRDPHPWRVVEVVVAYDDPP